MRDSHSKVLRRTLVAPMLVASLIVIQLFPADRSASKIADRLSLQGRESSQLQACVATPPDSGWYVVEVGDVATVRLPPDARLTTVRTADQNLTPEQRRALSELRGSWMLADYGGIGLSIRPRTESSTPKILADSGAGRNGWCIGRGGDDAFLARMVVGHLYASFGRHVEALWALRDGRELVLSGVTDTTAGNVLLQIARSVRLRQS